MTRFKELDRLRGLAIVMVMWCHINYFLVAEYYRYEFAQTWSGVDLFFVISGFVVTRSLLRLMEGAAADGMKPSSWRIWKKFILRRFTRIAPMSWLWALIPILLLLGPDLKSHYNRDLFKEFLAAATFTYNYFTVATGLNKLAPFWSLAVEEHFYLFLPMIVILIRDNRKRITACLLLTVFVIIGRIFLFNSRPFKPSQFQFLSHNRFDSLFIGVLIALAHPYLTKIFNQIKISQKIISMCCWTLCLFLILYPGIVNLRHMQTYGFTLLALAASFLVFIATQNQSLVLNLPCKGTNLMEAIGKRSYSLYLIHSPCIYVTITLKNTLLQKFSFDPPPFQLALLKIVFFVIFTTVVTELNFRFVETPLTKASQKFGFDKETTEFIPQEKSA